LEPKAARLIWLLLEHYYWLESYLAWAFKKLSICSFVGAEGCAPNLVTDSAAAAFAKETASLTGLFCAIATANAPLNTSPAAVASTAFTLPP